MFIRSKCNDYVVNSDHVMNLSIYDCKCQYAIIAELVDGSEIWLNCSENEDELRKELVKLTAKINEHPVQIYGTVNAYRCD